MSQPNHCAWRAVILIAALAFGVATQAQIPSDQLDFFRGAEAIEADCSAALETGNKRLDTLSAAEEPATFDNVMRPFDAMMVDVIDEFFINYLMTNVHPDETVRAAGAACFQRLYAFYNELSLNRPFYERVNAIDTDGLRPDYAYMVTYWRDQFRRSGVDKDADTRTKALALNQDIFAIGDEFDTNIRNAVDTITVSADRLAGLPEDYIDAHAPDENGMVTISTSYADVQPVLKYAHDDALRRQLYVVFNNRAWPENEAVLGNLLHKRHELATLLGHENFANLSMLGTMMGSPDRAREFLATLSKAIKPSVAREKAMLLARLREIDREAERVQKWQSSYVSNLVREEKYALDAKEVREYFHYDRVRDGILTLTSDLFGIRIEPWETTAWHEDAQPYEVYRGKKLIGRFFLDMHPRDGKFTHAAQFGVQFGVDGQQVPVAALVTNFPRGAMEHGQVETFLHEFGHLLHFIFAGQDEFGFRRFMLENDFGEAPSQMLEEWVWDYDTLAKFARDEEGKVIPRELVEKMNRARYFGQGIGTATQLSYAALSLSAYDRDPEGLSLEELNADVNRRMHPFGHLDGTHPYANFGHLNGYSSNYYTYQWSNAIAEDLLSRFRKEGLRNRKTAADYRDSILAGTGKKSANGLVEDFLGRPFSIDAYVSLLMRNPAN